MVFAISVTLYYCSHVAGEYRFIRTNAVSFSTSTAQNWYQNRGVKVFKFLYKIFEGRMVEIKKIRASHVFRASALIVIQRFHKHIRFGNTLTFVIHSTYFMYGRLAHL